jgi:hypothetical protein
MPYQTPLTDIAQTLQRLGGEWRAKGLALFEELLDSGVPHAQKLLQELDNRPLNTAPSTPQWRRGRRSVKSPG